MSKLEAFVTWREEAFGVPAPAPYSSAEVDAYNEFCAANRPCRCWALAKGCESHACGNHSDRCRLHAPWRKQTAAPEVTLDELWQERQGLEHDAEERIELERIWEAVKEAS